jgi:hypothetical protein
MLYGVKTIKQARTPREDIPELQRADTGAISGWTIPDTYPACLLFIHFPQFFLECAKIAGNKSENSAIGNESKGLSRCT